LLQNFRVPCPNCPLWFNGEKGLRWHVQQKHEAQYEQAKTQSIQQTTQALVVYRHVGEQVTCCDDQVSKGSINDDYKIRTALASGSSTGHFNTSVDSNCLGDPWDHVKRGDLAGLKHIIAAGCFVPSTAVDDKGASSLLWAAGGGHLAMVQYLVSESGCDPNYAQKGKRAFSGRTALHWAARNGHARVVDFLLSDGRCRVAANAATADGTTAFHWAAWQAHLNVLEILLKWSVGASMVEHVNSYGCNAALWAAQGSGTPLVLEWLYNAGCPIHVVNHSGHGILHKAAQRGRGSICEWFIRHMLLQLEGSRSGKSCLLTLIGPDNDGCLPSDLAGMEGHEDLALFLAQQEETFFVLALKANDPVPTWFSRAAVPCKYRVWEAWAGVARLRYAFEVKQIYLQLVRTRQSI
jgi:hypothetical protein